MATAISWLLQEPAKSRFMIEEIGIPAPTSDDACVSLMQYITEPRGHQSSGERIAIIKDACERWCEKRVCYHNNPDLKGVVLHLEVMAPLMASLTESSVPLVAVVHWDNGLTEQKSLLLLKLIAEPPKT